MISLDELQYWINEARTQGMTSAAVDQGCLSLIGFDKNAEHTGHCLDVGGAPENHSKCDECEDPVTDGMRPDSAQIL